MNIQELIQHCVQGFETFLHIHLLLAFLSYIYILLSQRKHFNHLKIQSYSKDHIPFDRVRAPRVSIVIPMHNEGCAVVESIDAALSSDYPNLEIIVVNDGSNDRCLTHVIERYGLEQSSRQRHTRLGLLDPIALYNCAAHPNLLLVDKPHSGKADSLNTGMDYASGSHICCMDADSIMLPDSLPKLITKFINEPNLVALGGAVAPSNQLCIRDGQIVRLEEPSTILERIQVVEYLRSFTLWRTGWSYLDGLLIISGAMTVFTREALINIGGFRADTVTEDLDVILRLHEYYCEQKQPYHIWTVPNVICWTRTPRTLRQLKRQRERWMIGALQCLTKNARLVLNARNRTLGCVALPHLILIEIFAPIIELIGLLALFASATMGILSYQSAIIYGFLVYALTGFYSWNAIYAGDVYFKNYSALHDDLRVGLVGLIEPIGYRQLDSLWRIIGWWKWLTNKKTTW